MCRRLWRIVRADMLWGGWLQHVVNPWQKTVGSLFGADLTACVVFKGRGGIVTHSEHRGEAATC